MSPSPLAQIAAAQSLTLGSLPDDALASILGGLSAQDAARAEATSKAFRRLRPRVVAAQRCHALRDTKCRLTVATDGHAYETREIRSFNGMLSGSPTRSPTFQSRAGYCFAVSREDTPSGWNWTGA